MTHSRKKTSVKKASKKKQAKSSRRKTNSTLKQAILSSLQKKPQKSSFKSHKKKTPSKAISWKFNVKQIERSPFRTCSMTKESHIHVKIYPHKTVTFKGNVVALMKKGRKDSNLATLKIVNRIELTVDMLKKHIVSMKSNDFNITGSHVGTSKIRVKMDLGSVCWKHGKHVLRDADAKGFDLKWMSETQEFSGDVDYSETNMGK